jgi:DNA-binding transcriptional ArsR family regulator
MSNPNGTQAVDRAARLLAEVVHSPDPITFTGLTAATGLAKSTTSRLLLALERNGLVRRDDRGRFLPGEMFVSFAWRASPVPGAGRPPGRPAPGRPDRRPGRWPQVPDR